MRTSGFQPRFSLKTLSANGLQPVPLPRHVEGAWESKIEVLSNYM
jgi:hypothetical protein